MGRKRKRKRRRTRRATKAELSEEQPGREMAVDEAVEEEEDDTEMNPASAAAAAAGEREEEEGIEGLLEPFTQDELLGLLVEACLRDPALRSRLAATAASDAAHRRLFVHGLGPGVTTAAMAASFASFGSLDECHAVADRATGRCRGYGFVTFRRRSAARRALADASRIVVGGRPVACQLSSLGPTSPDRKLFVDNVPACAAHDELRRLFSRFGEIEAGPLGADRATGQFRGYAIFFYKSPKGLTKALEERKVVFDGCELHCRRAHRANKEKHHMATHADAGDQSNDFVSAASPIVHGQPKEIALTSSKQTLLGSNRPVELMVKGPSSGTVPFCQNAGAGLLGAFPVAAVSPSTLDQSTMVNYSRDSTSTPRNDRLEMS
ncbi:UBP1-associated protein 2B-like [Oryza brachyantha]|uniref:UBP1-associated protein 2B-like n=1 Tax=Oryza brachyantha TaxID=4533 RepID=UPI001ADB43CB|nr:UBP1-associated protein 2B-like [Oryza brachyantha]XP_040376883.1 UBP1-associated protein 2B-like [Oryza brachyantha]